MPPQQELGQPGILAEVGLLVLFYGGTMLMSMGIGRKKENADGYMTADNSIGFGVSAAPMTATWIWASSMYARHGRSSQLMLAGSNVLGSLISLTSNFIAGGALIAILSPLSFGAGIVIVAAGVLLYTLWSGFRASVLTDFAQVMAMLGATVVIIPVVFFAAVLAYAIGNQTIAQRLFAVREDLIKPTFITATLGYGAAVIGIGMLGVMALYLGIEPMNGNVNNLLPQMAGTFLGPVLLAVAFIMIIGAMWGCLVFPVIASFYWKKVTNAAFTASVIAALVIFLPVRFEWIPVVGTWALLVELLATIGIGVVLGIMCFGFFGLRPAVTVGGLAVVLATPFTFFYLRDYTVLSASLIAYAVSFLVCYLMSFRSGQNFEFEKIKQVTGDFDDETPAVPTAAADVDTAVPGVSSDDDGRGPSGPDGAAPDVEPSPTR